MSEPVRKDAQNSECSRRQAFVRIGVGSIAVACAGASVFSYEFMAPNVLYEPSPIVNAGKPDTYPPGTVTQDLQTGIYIVHGPEICLDRVHWRTTCSWTKRRRFCPF